MMRVRTIVQHNDHKCELRSVGDIYQTDAHRASELEFSGFVKRVERLRDVRWQQDEGRVLSPLPSPLYGAAPLSRGPRVLQLATYDPGNAAYRYHSAANHVAGGESAFVRYGQANPFCDIRQYDGDANPAGIAALFDGADVVHVHMDYDVLEKHTRRWPDRVNQLLVRHYHGSDAVEKKHPPFIQNDLDMELGALQIGARLYHNRYSADMQWLPIPVPVREYANLVDTHYTPREERPEKMFRIAHSPTHPRIKGTVVLETVVRDLQIQGLPIELVMIKDKPHAEALAIKASCDATFDSFWLGIQGSGLEAACMGQPVVAGDADVFNDYRLAGIECPYSFVSGYDDLRAMIERLATDEAFRQTEAQRVGDYVRKYHDYPAVGQRYWMIIHRALAERGLHAAA